MSYARPTCQRPVLLDTINGGFLNPPSDAELRTAIRWALVTIDTQQAEIERLTKDRDQCRKLLREAVDKVYMDDEGNECVHVTSRWINAAEASGGE